MRRSRSWNRGSERRFANLGSTMKLAERYADRELHLICDYMESASEVSKRELANMLAVNGLRSSQVKPTESPRGRDSHHRSSTPQK
jgi:hypothetical protein